MEEDEMKVRLALGSTVVVLLAAFWWSNSQAWEEDEACRASCRDQQHLCVQACAEHPNPVECDARCRKEYIDCEKRCG